MDNIDVNISEEQTPEVVEIRVDENAAQTAIDAAVLAQQILDLCQGIIANFTVVNTIVVNNGFSKIGLVFTGFANSEWNINGVNYTNPTNQVRPIALCATGLERTDRVVLDTNNNFVIIPGEEVEFNPVPPSKPANTLDYTFIPVTDSEVGTPETPIVGNLYVKKQYANVHEFNGTGANAIIPFHPSGYSEIRLINAGLTSVSGFDLSLIVGNPTAEPPYQGKTIIVWNRTGAPLPFNNEDYDADYPLFLSDATDIVVPNNHKVYFHYDAGGLQEIFRSWVDLSGKADLVGGVVPSSQLPSYVDDVLEFSNLGSFPGTGETQKIYLALDTNFTYRWTGSVYSKISDTGKLDKVISSGVERAYGVDAAGNQIMINISDFGGTDIIVTKFFPSYPLAAGGFTLNNWYSFQYPNSFIEANLNSGTNYGSGSSPVGTPSIVIPSLFYIPSKKMNKFAWHMDYCDQALFKVSIVKYDLVSGVLANAREILNQQITVTSAGPNTQNSMPYSKNKVEFTTTDSVDTAIGAQCSVYFLFYQHLGGAGGGAGPSKCYFHFN